MGFNRREFLLTSGAGALALAASAQLASARGLLVDATLDEVVGRALGAAKRAGASYADCRIVRHRNESVFARENHIQGTSFSEDYGIGVRVIVNGAWGFAATARVDGKEAERVANLACEIAKANASAVKRPVTLAPEPPHVDVWQTPLEKDPFKIPIEDKADLLLALTAAACNVKGVQYSSAWYTAFGEWKLFASSEGAQVEQDQTRIDVGMDATAVDTTSGEFVGRGTELAPAQAGWEYVERAGLVDGARQVAEDAVTKLKAPGVVAGKKDLILAPTNLWLTIHESIGHPTELDRALGYEANFAGTSYATPEKLGKLRIGSDLVNVYADKTTPGSGWAGEKGFRHADIDAARVSHVAIEKAARSKAPRKLDPGRYTVILEPAAVAELFGFFTGSLDARSADEGRSFFATKGGGTRLGEQLFSDAVTIRRDPADPALPSAPYDGEGLPRSSLSCVDRGKLTGLFCSRFWAQKKGKKADGGGGPFSLAPGTASYEDLIKGCDRGVLITHFWYTRWVDPQSILITGLTRDGVFLVEKGEIVAPVNNFRFNESPVVMLKNVDAMTKQTWFAPLADGNEARVPAIRTHEFNLASVSEAV